MKLHTIVRFIHCGLPTDDTNNNGNLNFIKFTDTYE